MVMAMEKIKQKNRFGIFGKITSYHWSKLGLKITLILSLASLISCSSTKRASTGTADIKRISNLQNVVDYSKRYLGTPYKYGGNTSSGMDCSGLIQLSFMQYGIQLPRVSQEMSKIGKPIPLQHVEVGDLVFFRTSKNSRRINHVGLVVKRNKKNVEFIHSSSSQGVMISSILNPYWKRNYVRSRRIVF